MIHSVPDSYGVGRDERRGAFPVFAGLAAFWTLFGIVVWALA